MKVPSTVTFVQAKVQKVKNYVSSGLREIQILNNTMSTESFKKTGMKESILNGLVKR